MTITTQDEREAQGEALAAQVFDYLRTKLPEEMTTNDNGFEYADWDYGKVVGVRADRGTGWTSYYSGHVQLIVYGSRITSPALPRKSYILKANDWLKTANKAVELITKRLAAVKNAKIAEDERYARARTDKERKTRLFEATGINITDESEKLWLIRDALVVNDELLLEIDELAHLDAQQTARLFAILGGKLKVTIKQHVTPQQWQDVRAILKGLS